VPVLTFAVFLIVVPEDGLGDASRKDKKAGAGVGGADNDRER